MAYKDYEALRSKFEKLISEYADVFEKKVPVTVNNCSQ